MNIKGLFVAAAIALAGSFAVSSASAADAVGLPGVEIGVAELPNYVGVTVGQRTGDDRHTSVGVSVGRQLNKNIAVEGQYEHGFNRKNGDTVRDRVSGNVLVGQRIGAVTPYVVGGLGYEWRDGADDRAVYAVGGGAKLHVTERVDLDGRYRYINSLDSGKRGAENLFTVGVNFKF